MRAVFLGLMIILVGTARGQFLGGIFDQGATELREYGQQIAALALLIDRSEKGYRIVESGLADIGGFTGTEYGLHQHYFESLAAVNQNVAQMPEVGEILGMEAAMVRGMGSAVNRWQASGRLTAGEMGVAAQEYAGVCQEGEEILGELRVVLTDNNLVMGDGERMGRVVALAARMRELAQSSSAYSAGGDLLVAQRKRAAGE
jgi:hypothetical protein